MSILIQKNQCFQQPNEHKKKKKKENWNLGHALPPIQSIQRKTHYHAQPMSITNNIATNHNFNQSKTPRLPSKIMQNNTNA